MQEFLKAVREACGAAVWSRGVELARANAVLGEREENGEVALRVSTKGGMIAPRVTLHLDDEDWECSCGGAEDPCEHIAAATIALSQARKLGSSLPGANSDSAPGTLRYRLSRAPGGLAIEREIVHAGGVHLLASTLDALARKRVPGPAFVATQADLGVERALGPQRRGPVARGVLPQLFEALSRCDDVQLEGVPVEVSLERVGPLGRLVDAPGGFRLYVERDPRILETLGAGVVRCDATLHLVGESVLSGREMEELPRGRFYSFDDSAKLVSEVLPSLRERIPVELCTEKLPEVARGEKPRLRIEIERRGDELSVLPLLVYGDPPIARVDAGKLVPLSGTLPVRDEAAERFRIRQLQEELALAPGHRVNLRAGEAVALAQRLADWQGDLVGDGHRSFHRLAGLEPRFEVRDDDFELRFDLPGAPAGVPTGVPAGVPAGVPTGVPTRDAPAQGGAAGAGRSVRADVVLDAWRRGETLVPLDLGQGGGFAELPQDWLQRYGSRIADLLAARDAGGRLAASALPELGQLCDDLDEPRPAGLERLAPLIEGFDGIPRAALPADLTAPLRHYQEQGVDWLCFMREAGLGALLADDMGLGKTLQALCALHGRSLVVTPTSVLHSWADEIRRFRPALPFHIYHGAGRQLPERQPSGEAVVVLTSYAILRLDSDRLSAEAWDCVVLDEAQNIKNPQSQVAQAAFGLQADFRLALTGTPVENRLDELWSQLHFLNPGLLGGRRDFQERYARPIADADATAAERLRQRIRPFLLRRLKRDVAPELPPRSEVVLHCELSDEERSIYDAIRAATVPRVVEQLRAGGNVIAALEALLRLRQAACHPALVPGQEAAHSSKVGSSKVGLLVSRLEEAVADGHKALVFSQWTSLLDLVEPHLNDAAIEFTRLDGSTRDRRGVVASFQQAEGASVMLVSLRAGGSGLNLTAADHVFLLDPWWNPAVEDQAADRAHRIGQTRPVVVHRIVAQNTIEEGVLQLHARKRALSDVAVGGAVGGEGLSRDDLLVLLS
ncbi:MAG: DEAD/DEAH box helicase [Deltaproteobacteria bacterium]|nr:DEAD/DEAH box helicase [Deltaproteobacteria bacterium]